jgi:hypothetical protein
VDLGPRERGRSVDQRDLGGSNAAAVAEQDRGVLVVGAEALLGTVADAQEMDELGPEPILHPQPHRPLSAHGSPAAHEGQGTLDKHAMEEDATRARLRRRGGRIGTAADRG